MLWLETKIVPVFAALSRSRNDKVTQFIHTHIQYCKELKVIKVSEIIDHDKLPVPSSMPDHSLLVGTFDISTNEEFISATNITTQPNQSLPENAMLMKSKKNVKKIDEDFFISEAIMEQVNNTILKIELMNVNQNTLNEIYSEIKTIFLNEMSKLPDLPNFCSKKGKDLKGNLTHFGTKSLSNCGL